MQLVTKDGLQALTDPGEPLPGWQSRASDHRGAPAGAGGEDLWDELERGPRCGGPLRLTLGAAGSDVCGLPSPLAVLRNL